MTTLRRPKATVECPITSLSLTPGEANGRRRTVVGRGVPVATKSIRLRERK